MKKSNNNVEKSCRHSGIKYLIKFNISILSTQPEPQPQLVNKTIKVESGRNHGGIRGATPRFPPENSCHLQFL